MKEREAVYGLGDFMIQFKYDKSPRLMLSILR